MFAGNFAPAGWATCDGQLLPISQNAALFSVLGTMYGGDGVRTFALPDLRGRVPLHQGQGPGLSPYVPGEQAGVQAVSLTANQMPSHTHAVNASSNSADQPSPAAGVWASPLDSTGAGGTGYTKTAPNTTMAPNAIAPAGGSQPVPVLQPLLCVTFIIALSGVFPSRA
jgi:microcystin-dependent protein